MSVSDCLSLSLVRDFTVLCGADRGGLFRRLVLSPDRTSTNTSTSTGSRGTNAAAPKRRLSHVPFSPGRRRNRRNTAPGTHEKGREGGGDDGEDEDGTENEGEGECDEERGPDRDDSGDADGAASDNFSREAEFGLDDDQEFEGELLDSILDHLPSFNDDGTVATNRCFLTHREHTLAHTAPHAHMHKPPPLSLSFSLSLSLSFFLSLSLSL